MDERCSSLREIPDMRNQCIPGALSPPLFELPGTRLRSPYALVYTMAMNNAGFLRPTEV